jgi:hypothetical protein
LKEGAVTLVLRGAGGAEEVFRQERPKRDGIYPVEVKPRAEGTFDLVFRIESAAGSEDVAAGRVRVGSAAAPGGVPFLKEQQWRTEFATAPAREGALAEGVEGPALVKPVGGLVAVALSGDALSVASLVGFITLFGIATRNGVLLVSHYEHLMRDEGLPLREAVVRGSHGCLAPVLMTALTAGLALIPLVLAGDKPGNQI